MLTADLILVDAHELLVGNVEFAHLVRQDGHLVGVVLLHQEPVRPDSGRNAVLDLVLQVVVALAQLLLVPVPVVNPDRQGHGFLASRSQLARTLRDTLLSDLVKHLQLVQQLPLILNQLALRV